MPCCHLDILSVCGCDSWVKDGMYEGDMERDKNIKKGMQEVWVPVSQKPSRNSPAHRLHTDTRAYLGPESPLDTKGYGKYHILLGSLHTQTHSRWTWGK